MEDNMHDHTPERTNEMNGRASLGYHSQSHMKKNNRETHERTFSQKREPTWSNPVLGTKKQLGQS